MKFKINFIKDGKCCTAAGSVRARQKLVERRTKRQTIQDAELE